MKCNDKGFNQGGDNAALSPCDNIVRARRKALGLSQQKLADSAGMHYKQIQKLEWGETDPGNVTLRNGLRLAKALGIAPEELMKKPDEP